MHGWLMVVAVVVVFSGCGASTEPPQRAAAVPAPEAPRDGVPPPPRVEPAPLAPEAAGGLRRLACIGGNCTSGTGALWMEGSGLRGLAVGAFANGRLLEGDLHARSGRRIYRFSIPAPGEVALLRRARYVIELPLGKAPLPDMMIEATVKLAGGGAFPVYWNDGIVSIPPEAVRASSHPDLFSRDVPDEVAAAALVAEDLRVWLGGPVRAVLSGTEPSMWSISMQRVTYLVGLGLVTDAKPAQTSWCLASEVCELSITGPGERRGAARFVIGQLVSRPRFRAHTPRAWREILPGRLLRLRDGLTATTRELATIATELGDQTSPDLAAARLAALRSLAALRDALDAVADAIEALPASQTARSVELEVIEQELRVERGKLEMLAAILEHATASPNITRVAALGVFELLDLRTAHERAAAITPPRRGGK